MSWTSCAGFGDWFGDWQVCRAVCRAVPCVCYDVVPCRCYDLALHVHVLTALPHRAASDLVCAAVLAPCAVSGLLYVAVAVCRYIAVADTRRRATRGACIATRIALPTIRIRGRYDNISVTNKQIQYEIIHTQ